MGKRNGYASLGITMAKHIKKRSRETKNGNNVIIDFKLEEGGRVCVQDNTFGIREELTIEGLKRLAESALSETGCDGIVLSDLDSCRVKLFGRPVKPFNMLQRLIKKYSGVYIDQRDIMTQFYDARNNETVDDAKYLCYDEGKCQEGIDFIRGHRKGRDVLAADIANVEECCDHARKVTTQLKLIVKTRSGKVKFDKTIRC
jgi:SepF-like predicted cell division protein (DUF552 family)